ncbi:MAG: glycosyltransferase [Lachnospiraceae bacterium]|nr:glycosyltransferase [Lachnospiraceae bacterium]
MNFDVSVIVPVYGVEQYIQNCVDHLLNQTLENLEVVLVNDCTPDRSMEICEELYGDNERVQLINQPCNMGAGEARNAGIRKARGKYIGFVDSDDQVLPEMFETMYRTAVEFDADVVHNTGIIAIVPAQGDVIPVDMADPDRNLLFQVTVDQKPVTEAALFSDDMDDRLDCWLMHGCHWAVWNQLYRREFLLEHDIFFAKMKLAEDLLFSLTCLFTAERYVRLPGEWYIYRPAANSLSRSGDSLRGTLKALDSQLRGLEAIRERIRTIPYFRDNRGKARIAIEHMLGDLLRGFIRLDYEKFGEARMREDEDIHAFFVQEFGGKAEYVEFLFFELLRQYPPMPKTLDVFSDPKVWEIVRCNYPKYVKSGNLADLWDGFNLE